MVIKRKNIKDKDSFRYKLKHGLLDSELLVFSKKIIFDKYKFFDKGDTNSRRAKRKATGIFRRLKRTRLKTSFLKQLNKTYENT